jgi:hypothetical protein
MWNDSKTFSSPPFPIYMVPKTSFITFSLYHVSLKSFFVTSSQPCVYYLLGSQLLCSTGRVPYLSFYLLRVFI